MWMKRYICDSNKKNADLNSRYVILSFLSLEPLKGNLKNQTLVHSTHSLHTYLSRITFLLGASHNYIELQNDNLTKHNVCCSSEEEN